MNNGHRKAAVKFTVVPAAVLAILFGVGARADTMRCGKWVVDETMSPGEIIHKCGEPTSREVKTEDVQTRGAGGGMMKRGTTTVETWLYSDSAIAMKVVVVDGKTKSITRAD